MFARSAVKSLTNISWRKSWPRLAPLAPIKYALATQIPSMGKILYLLLQIVFSILERSSTARMNRSLQSFISRQQRTRRISRSALSPYARTSQIKSFKNHSPIRILSSRRTTVKRSRAERESETAGTELRFFESSSVPRQSHATPQLETLITTRNNNGDL